MKKFLSDIEIRGSIEITSINNVAGNFVTRTAGGVLSVRTPAQVLSDIGGNFSGSTSIILSGLSFQRAALIGDVVASQNNNSTTIANAAVSNAKMANMAANTIKGRITSSGAPQDLTVAQVKSMLDISDGIGLDPNSPDPISFLAKAETKSQIDNAGLHADTIGFYNYDPAYFVKYTQFTVSGINTVNLLSAVNIGRVIFTPDDMLAGKTYKLELLATVTSNIILPGDGVALRIGVGNQKFTFTTTQTLISSVISVFIFYISFYPTNKVRVGMWSNLAMNNITGEMTIDSSIPQEISLDYQGKRTTDQMAVSSIIMKPVHTY